MQAERNVEKVKAMYDAFGRGDAEAILEHVADDVDWSTDAAIISAPWYGRGATSVRSRASSRRSRKQAP